MDEAVKILIIIVSSALTLLLIVGIIAGIIVVRLLKDVKSLVNKAAHVIESTEAVGDFLRHAKGPWLILKIIKGLVNNAKKEG